MILGYNFFKEELGMKALKKNGLVGGVAALLVVAVLGLFSLTGCVSSQPYMANAVDIVAGSEDDPFVGTKWTYKAEGGGGAGVVFETGDLVFYENGTVSWNRNKPTKYTLVSGDSGYMVGIKNGVRMGTMSFSLYLSIDNPSATEGVVNIKSSIGAEYSSPATKM